jgi:ABC-type nickel/cobalt efflux system permease component RcnA
MIAILLLGLLLGMRHALEADHVAAVASLVFTTKSPRNSLLHGAVWGVGHTLTLIVVSTFVILTQSAISTTTAAVLEGCVGVMLVLLGLDVARRMVRGRIHLHVHEHTSGVRHFHAHSHTDRSAAAHDHAHRYQPAGAAAAHCFPTRALFIGLMHGLAGSAALILLALRSTDSIALGLAYMGLFGLGSMIGMAVLSVVIAVPLNYSGKHMRRLQFGLQCSIAVANIAVGSNVILASYSGA